jgi:hypothetical protein
MMARGAFALALAVWSMHAQAYIDPGSGGFVLQMLLAALAAGGVWVGARWRMLMHIARSFLSRRKRGPDDTD